MKDACIKIYRIRQLKMQCPSCNYHGEANISEEWRQPMQGGSIRTKAGRAD